MKKIMFNDRYGLTRAVLEGRKTMTRRVITIPEKWHGIEVYGFCHVKGRAALELTDGDDFCIDDPRTGQCAQILPTYRIGEEVAVAQTYTEIRNTLFADDAEWDLDYLYQVQDAHEKVWGDIEGMDNKMFVRAELMPYRIRIKDVKVERLQDISDEDCLKEGIFPDKASPFCYTFYGNSLMSFSSPKLAFQELIDKVSGKGTWEENPYVFTYEFELIQLNPTEL